MLATTFERGSHGIAIILARRDRFEPRCARHRGHGVAPRSAPQPQPPRARAFAVGTGASVAATQTSVGLPPAVALALGLSGVSGRNGAREGGDYLRRNFVADAAAKALPAVVNLTSDVQKGWVRARMSAGERLYCKGGWTGGDERPRRPARAGRQGRGHIRGRTEVAGARPCSTDAASDLAVVQCEGRRSTLNRYPWPSSGAPQH